MRGRVIKLWNIISGFDTLITEYQYNSQDQVINYTHKGPDDFKRFRNLYDYAGRLFKVDFYDNPSEEDNPEYYFNLLKYDYNENSQIQYLKMNRADLENTYTYNNRNWISSMNSAKYKFNYENIYYKNGNVKSQELTGEYSSGFSNSSDLTFTYKYDRSNRLTEGTTSSKNFDVINTYDKDGNILTLDRNGSTGYSLDDFNYAYYSGTNKLSKVKGSSNQYAYDLNGNMITDSLNNNFNIQYDYRNLITQLTHRVIASLTIADTSFYKTYYYYDETGNRILKKVYNDENDSLLSDIIYSRDVSGKEMAVYENGSIKQWNIWGSDNAGFINASGDVRYYLKDHLGSVRAVVDNEGSIVSSQDYDMWGYLLQDRTFDSGESIYKFTSKERDDESKYDYFGARYYDARVGRWGSVEPLLNEFIQFSPYNYSLNNPIRLLDDDGNGPKDGIKLVTTTADIKASFNEIIERVSLGYEKLSSGDFSGALQQMIENATESPRLLGGLIPSDFTTDFIMPLGMVKGSGNLLKLTEGLTLKDQASEIRSFIGKNRVTMPEGTLDLVGRSHGGIETPHFKPLIVQENKGKFFTKTLDKLTRPATKEDLKRTTDFVNKLILKDILKLNSNTKF